MDTTGDAPNLFNTTNYIKMDVLVVLVLTFCVNIGGGLLAKDRTKTIRECGCQKVGRIMRV